jgi:hypothetical protein
MAEVIHAANDVGTFSGNLSGVLKEKSLDKSRL